jgi:hypothetical protein
MNDAERLMVSKCGEILYRATVEARYLAWNYQPGAEKRIAELMDIVHNIPRFLIGHDDYAIVGFRDALVKYAKQYGDPSDPDQSEYVRILDMDATEFEEEFRQKSWDWPVPASVPA